MNPIVSRAVIWPADNPDTAHELAVDGQPPPWTVGVDIDDDGTVLGFVGRRPSETQHPYVWPARGPAHALTAPAGTSHPEGVAIRAPWVAGTAVLNGRSVPVRWDLRSDTATAISTDASVAFAINRRGIVAARGALIHRGGRTSSLGTEAMPTVLTDPDTAAGSDAFVGNAVSWTHC